MAKRNKYIGFLFFCLSILLTWQNCFAAILADWQDSNAYKPKLIQLSNIKEEIWKIIF